MRKAIVFLFNWALTGLVSAHFVSAQGTEPVSASGTYSTGQGRPVLEVGGISKNGGGAHLMQYAERRFASPSLSTLEGKKPGGDSGNLTYWLSDIPRFQVDGLNGNFLQGYISKGHKIGDRVGSFVPFGLSEGFPSVPSISEEALGTSELFGLGSSRLIDLQEPPTDLGPGGNGQDVFSGSMIQDRGATIIRRIVDKKELALVDSLIGAGGNEVIQGYAQRVIEVDSIRKNLVFEERPTFLDKTYLDALIGVFPQPLEIDQVSPALGFYLSKKSSIGLGPNFNLRPGEDVKKSLLGLRGFFRQDVLKGRVYLQFEDIVHQFGNIDPSSETTGKYLDHLVSLGAGTRISLLRKLDLNLAGMVNLMNVISDPGKVPTIMFRMGISTSK